MKNCAVRFRTKFDARDVHLIDCPGGAWSAFLDALDVRISPTIDGLRPNGPNDGLKLSLEFSVCEINK